MFSGIMSIARGEQAATSVPYERVMDIAAGDVPASVTEIDAVGSVANQFQPLWSSTDKQRQEPRIYGRYVDGVAQREVISSVEYRQLASRGSRDYWRQSETEQAVLRTIAMGSMPQGYVGAHDARSQQDIRQEAFSLLALSQEIMEVERTERASAIIEQRNAWLAMRLPSMATTVFTQETVMLPTVTEQKNQRPPEVTSHRSKPKNRVATMVGNLVNRISAIFEPVFA